MQIFRNTNFDFLGKKMPFIIGSAVMLIAGIASLVVKGGPRYGIDFEGGITMYVKFAAKPQEDKIRQALSAKVPGEISVQPIVGVNEVMIGTELREERDLDEARQTVVQTLATTFSEPGARPDFNALGQDALVERLRDPLQGANVALSTEDLRGLVERILEYRDTPPRSGLLMSFDNLSGVEGVSPAVIQTLKQELSLAPFAVRSVEVVGPKIGRELRQQALMATLLSLAGMLVYIAFRFEWIYGIAAVLAVAHDVLVTVGLFSILDKEISLTVIAALLTLVGYSMNDTIVVFDRIRENLKSMRRESFYNLVNASVNQTLSRTVMTSALTFLTVLALFLFGGQVLNGFSFALVIGIIVGSYSSIFVASPLLVYWYDLVERRKKTALMGAASKPVEKDREPAGGGRPAVKKNASKASR